MTLGSLQRLRGAWLRVLYGRQKGFRKCDDCSHEAPTNEHMLSTSTKNRVCTSTDASSSASSSSSSQYSASALDAASISAFDDLSWSCCAEAEPEHKTLSILSQSEHTHSKRTHPPSLGAFGDASSISTFDDLSWSCCAEAEPEQKTLYQF